MKRYYFLPLIISVLFFTVSVFAVEANKNVVKTTKVNTDLIVDNLHNGLNSDNYGIRVSSAYVLGQLISSKYINSDDASKTIIPLLKMLKDEKDDCARIVAAFTLYQLKSERGIAIIHHFSKYEESERFNKVCDAFYNEYLTKGFTE